MLVTDDRGTAALNLFKTEVKDCSLVIVQASFPLLVDHESASSGPPQKRIFLH